MRGRQLREQAYRSPSGGWTRGQLVCSVLMAVLVGIINVTTEWILSNSLGLTVVDRIQHMIQFNVRNYSVYYYNIMEWLMTFTRKVPFSNLKSFFFIHSIRLSMVHRQTKFLPDMLIYFYTLQAVGGHCAYLWVPSQDVSLSVCPWEPRRRSSSAFPGVHPRRGSLGLPLRGWGIHVQRRPRGGKEDWTTAEEPIPHRVKCLRAKNHTRFPQAGM